MTGLDGINSLEKALGTAGVAESRRTSTSSSNQAEAGKTAGADQASVSSAGGLISQASDVRLEKVESLRQAIAAGTYKVSSSAVADKLVESMLQGK